MRGGDCGLTFIAIWADGCAGYHSALAVAVAVTPVAEVFEVSEEPVVSLVPDSFFVVYFRRLTNGFPGSGAVRGGGSGCVKL